jgi:PAS domain S-box-containing protein
VADVTERKQVEEALMAKEAELELILRSTPFMLTRCSRDLRYLYASRPYAKMLGRNQEAVAGRSIAEIIGEKAFATIKPHVEAVLRGERVEYESDIDFEGVGIRRLAVTYVPEVDESGGVVGWVASIIDMTGQRRAEKALAESQDRLALALEAAGGAMWGWNIPENRLDEWDPIYRKLFGFSGQEPPRIETWLARLHPEDSQRLEKRLEQMLRTPGDDIWDEEFRILHPERGERWLFGLGKCLRDGSGKVVRMTGVCMDVTERRDAQEVLRRNKEELTRKQAELLVLESERRFILLANSAPVLIWASGPDKLCTFFNQPWLNFTGRSLEQELGNGWAEGVHVDDLAGCIKVYNESFDARRPFTMEYRLRRYDGQYRWVSDHGVPRYDAQGDFLGYIGSCVDATERKDAEAEARRAYQELAHVSRVSTLGELAGSLAHELNQPLAAILSNAQAAQRFLKDGRAGLDEMREILNDIVVQDRRAGEVIVRMRAMLRKGEIQVTPLQLNEVIEDVLGLMHAELISRRVTISRRLAKDLPPVSADRVQLQQVFLNLIVNACDAMSGNPPPDRRLTITSELVDGEHVQAAVTDTGPGFAGEALQRIFEPFRTTKPTGLGLGLPICRSIIHAHGGEICAENGKERGATVRFTLTVKKQEVP